MATQPGFRILIAFSIIFLLGINLSTAQEPYFKGKTIRIIAGFPGGGGVDAESRMLARFLPAVIPGNPTISCKTCRGPAAPSPATGSNNLPSPTVSPFTTPVPPASISRRWALKKPNMISAHWPVIGSVRRGTSVALIRKKSLDRLTGPGEPLKVGVRSGDESWNGIFLWGAEFLKWNVRWVQGYPGGGEIQLAFERNETDIYPTATLPTLRKFVGQGFHPFVQQGMLTASGSFQRQIRVPRCSGVRGCGERPTAQRGAVAGLYDMGGLGQRRPAVSRGAKTPAEILRVLRDAFARMREGAEFKAEVKRVSGEDAQILLADEAEQILRQLLVVSPAIQDFTNGLMKKYLSR